jgi:enoyl-[acyl-carrier-protein] reductase (NADH)
MGIPADQLITAAATMTHRKRLTTLAELTAVAVFLASDKASAMTGTVANLTGGIIAD